VWVSLGRFWLWRCGGQERDVSSRCVQLVRALREAAGCRDEVLISRASFQQLIWWPDPVEVVDPTLV
jgi:hypothetical protein